MEANGVKRSPHRHHDGVYGVSVTQLHDLQEPYQTPTAVGIEKILPASDLSAAHASS
jgi:hypothetical protein